MGFVRTAAGWIVPDDCEFSRMPLSVEFAHERDAHIFFREHDHQYFICGLNCYSSSTSVCHSQFSHFDAPAMAQSLVMKPAFRKGEGQYSKYRDFVAMHSEASDAELVAALIDKWDNDGREASALGTTMHRNIELRLNGLPYSDHSVEFTFYSNFERECIHGRNWLIYRTEWLIWTDLPVKICGSIDALFVDPDGHYHMRDWKRSKQISYHGFGKKGAPPFDHLPDCNYIAYSLQQNVYAEILRRYYDIEVQSMAIVVCYPGNDDFLEIPIRRMDKEVEFLFNQFSVHR